MHPILFHVGETPVHTYGFTGAVGFLVVTAIILFRSRALGLDRDKVVDVIFWGSIAGIVGARAIFVYQNLDRMDSPLMWINLRAGGLVFYGAMLFGLPMGAAMMWRHRLPFYRMMDVLACALPIGHAISRLGCFFAGCCYGIPTDLPWGVVFTNELTDAPHDISLHPTQLYAAVYLFAIGGLVNWFYPRTRFNGQAMLLYLMLYAVARSVNEVLRGDAERGWFLESLLGQTITVSQGLSIVVAAVALLVFFAGARRAAPPAEGPPA